MENVGSCYPALLALYLRTLCGFSITTLLVLFQKLEAGAVLIHDLYETRASVCKVEFSAP